MREEETIERAKEIHTLHQNGQHNEAKKKFKKLVEDTMAWCKHCKKYVSIELDKSTGDKPFYFCILCGQKVKRMNIKEEKLIAIKFHKKGE